MDRLLRLLKKPMNLFHCNACDKHFDTLAQFLDHAVIHPEPEDAA